MSRDERRRGPKGRGAAENPTNRFTGVRVEGETPLPDPKTTFIDDHSRRVIATNQSPDVPFSASINPYRGCEHGCSYCYARPTHEYLGMSAGLDFESRIVVKRDAPALLRSELASPSWRPQPLGLSGVTDPYQPIERRLEISRGCLEVLAESRNPVMVVTKNALVRRDIDLLSDLAGRHAATVALSITTLDGDLARRMEPRCSHPRQRLAALTALALAGVPCGVLVAPVIPAINDHEIPAIVEAAAGAGATYASRIMVRLPGVVAPLFADWLGREFPDRRDRVLRLIQEMRGGRLNDPRFGHRGRGHGARAVQAQELFEGSCRRHGLALRGPQLETASFRRPNLDGQLDLFDS